VPFVVQQLPPLDQHRRATARLRPACRMAVPRVSVFVPPASQRSYARSSLVYRHAGGLKGGTFAERS